MILVDIPIGKGVARLAEVDGHVQKPARMACWLVLPNSFLPERQAVGAIQRALVSPHMHEKAAYGAVAVASEADAGKCVKHFISQR